MVDFIYSDKINRVENSNDDFPVLGHSLLLPDPPEQHKMYVFHFYISTLDENATQKRSAVPSSGHAVLLDVTT